MDAFSKLFEDCKDSVGGSTGNYNHWQFYMRNTDEAMYRHGREYHLDALVIHMLRMQKQI